MTFGTKLIQLRKNKKLSQREVADYVGVSQTAYSEWEADKVSFQVKYLPKLAEIFEVDPVELIPGASVVKIMNNQHQNNHENPVYGFEVNMSPQRNLVDELINTKDEVIRLLKENAALKDGKAE